MAIRKGFTRSRQQGVVLLVSLVFLIALTAVASALMLNTTTDMKMAGASQQKVRATQEAISAIDEVILDKKNDVSGNKFASDPTTFPIVNISVTQSDVKVNIEVANANKLVTDCPSSRLASSIQIFKCNTLKIQSEKKYGHKSNSNITVNAGIAQQMFNVGN